MSTGKVYLVGAGPGKPDLITVRGLRILREADVVVYDYLVDERLLDEAREGAELIRCDGLRSRKAAGLSVSIEELNRLVVEQAGQGKKVIRLKNGDPSLFGRLSRELEALVENKIGFEIVPGVTAASAAAAFTGVPLTDRRFSSSVALVTGREDPVKDITLIDWEGISGCSTIVLYMGVGNLRRTVEELRAVGKSPLTPVVVVTRAGGPEQRTVRARLEDLADKTEAGEIAAPAIFIIGETAKLEREFNWSKINKRIWFTGLSRERFFLPGNYFHLPLIKIEPMENYDELDGYIRRIREFAWIVFTSRYGVKYFFRRLNSLEFDSRHIAGRKIAAIGKSTENMLLNFGVRPDLIPELESSRGLIREFKNIDLRGKQIFLPRSDISDKGLGEALKEQGARVWSSFAYRNRMPDNLPDLDLNSFDQVIFTSPSTVRNFIERYKRLPAKVKVRCIGAVTREEARRCRLLN